MGYDYCKCDNVNGVYTELEEFGYWDVCNSCDKKIEDGFHYHDEPELY